MTIPDVNVLIQAFRPDSSNHTRCKVWLESVANGNAPFGVVLQVFSSVLRIVTHRGIYAEPDDPPAVFKLCNGLLDRENCVVVAPGVDHWKIFTRLCDQTNARGNLVSDAWFAALAMESGCEWVTLDRDFARFKGLKWRMPE